MKERIGHTTSVGFTDTEAAILAAIRSQHPSEERDARLNARLILLGALTYFREHKRGKLPEREYMVDQIRAIMLERMKMTGHHK